MKNVEYVDKKGQVILTETFRVSGEDFAKETSKFSHFRLGTLAEKNTPFGFLYFRIGKLELRKTLRMYPNSKVEYNVMYNSRVNPKMQDVVFVSKISIKK